MTLPARDQSYRNAGLPTLISTGVGDNYVHTAGVARDGDDWLLQDAVGSVRATVDDTGNTVGTQDFTVFGEQLAGTGSFGFAGEQQDPTGQLHLRARQYNPGLGRFTSVDPVQPGAPATTGYNLYAYSGNNPTTWTDPSGESVLSEYAQIVRDRATAVATFAQINTGRFIIWQTGLGAAGNCGLGVAEESAEEILSYSSNNEYSMFAIAATLAYGCASGAADGISPDDPAQAGRPRVSEPSPAAKPRNGGDGTSGNSSIGGSGGGTSCDLYCFGNTTKPGDPRVRTWDEDAQRYRGDIDVDSDGNVHPPPSPIDITSPIQGKSTTSDVELTSLTGHYWRIPEGTVLPTGLGVVADGSDVGGTAGPGHHTIFPTETMSLDRFTELFQELPWEYVGKR